MPYGKHQVDLEIPIDYIWDFVSDMNKWAPLVPGYVTHEILNTKQSTWTFKGDVGIIQKTVCLQVDITEWKEPTTVSFRLTGVNENFEGNGFFEAKEINEYVTRMTGCLNITAKGFTGPMINSVLKSFVPKTTKELTTAVANELVPVTSRSS